MLQKFLQKRLQKVILKTPYSQMLANAMTRLSFASEYNIEVKWIIKACRQFIKILQAMNVINNFEQIKQIMKLIQDLTMQIHNDDIYQVLLIKIRCFLINFKLLNQHDNIRLKKSHKIKIFLSSLQHSRFYLLLQQDFYSNLQLVYLQAIKINFIEQNPYEALNLTKLCLQTVKKQLTILSEFGNDYSGDKMNKILQNKNKTLELLFFFQHGARYSCSNTPSNQIITELLSKYERLFIKTTMQFNSHQLVAKTTKTIRVLQNQKKITASNQFKDIATTDNKSQYHSENNSNPQIFIPTIHQFPSYYTTQVRIGQNSNQLNMNSYQILSSCQNIQSGYNLPMFTSSNNQFLSIPNHQRFEQSMKFIDQLRQKPSLFRDNSIAQRVSIQLPEEGNFLKSNSLKNSKKLSNFQKNKSQQLQALHQQNDIRAKIPTEINDNEQSIQKIIKRKKKNQFRTRTFSLVVRAQNQQKQKLKKLVPQKQNKQKIQLKTSPTQMLKNGIFVFIRGN